MRIVNFIKSCANISVCRNETGKSVVDQEKMWDQESLNNLAFVYEKQGKYDAAETWYKQSLAIKRRMWGEEHPDTASSLYNLSHVYKELSKYNEAEDLCKQALAIQRRM